ncbi:MAG: hypothetical protein ACRDTT_31970 [Pseudonocardiaceae bacterium]
MSPHQSRGTTAGRVFNDLRNMARREGRSTDELLVFYVLERFLHRVSRSPYADQLVLKGGMLLAVLDARRNYGSACTRRGGAARWQRRWHIPGTSPKSCDT